MKDEYLWIQAAKEGDTAAFEQLIYAYEKPAYALALRICQKPEYAAEAAQEAFLAVWRGLSAFRGDAKFSTWLYRLVSNAAIDLLRREKRHSGTLSLDDEALNPNIPDDLRFQPQSHMERQELRDAIEAGLATLSPESRQVLLLREMQQLTYEEIADALHVELGTVKSRISRARRQLRLYLLENGNFFDADTSYSMKGDAK
ncbi:MAG: sigma-70 family RNA polymerase sigma factor [Oscillibacter sp.]|nr:sigma-70 family RNA polymerase sigma factor [Oscillibacter sp.]